MPFVYPHNFIRPGMPSKRLQAPSHAQFEGLSGTIRCKLTTETPLFTPDPASNVPMDVGTPGHRELRFFECDFGDGGGVQYALPGTGLKGMIRSVAETLSNSCWSQFDDSWVHPWRPDHRWWNAQEMRRRPGRVLKDGNGGLVVREMTEAWLPLADARPYSHGAPVTVTVRRQRHRNGFYYVACTSIAAGHTGAPDTREGYVKIVPRYATVRHYQRVFVEWYDWDTTGEPQLPDLPVDKEVQGIWQNARWGPDPLDKNPAPLKEGELVWYTAVEENGTTEIESIGPVALYKRHYKSTRAAALRQLTREQIRALAPDTDRQELKSLASKLEPCRDTKDLCLCCRLFGFVGDGAPTQEMTAQDSGLALAGKVSFSFATTPVHGTATLPALPLRILGEPQPKFAPFYLTDNADHIRSWDDQNPAPPLRGRKGYWHHGTRNHDYYKAPQGKTKFNATVTPLAPGAVFGFDVNFENLSAVELGCLLLSLDLWGDLRHKFGMGKPVGLGSCRIEVETLNLIRRRRRYRAADLFGATDRLTAEPELVEALKERFRRHLVQEAGGRAAFEALPQIRDCSILWGLQPALPIRYYPPAYERNPFAYFAAQEYTPLRSLDEVQDGQGQPD